MVPQPSPKQKALTVINCKGLHFLVRPKRFKLLPYRFVASQSKIGAPYENAKINGNKLQKLIFSTCSCINLHQFYST